MYGNGSYFTDIVLNQIKIKSNFIYIGQNRNDIASVGFTICTVNDILSPYTLDSSEEKPAMLTENTPLTG